MTAQHHEARARSGSPAWFHRAGAACAVVGSAAAGVGNLLHPVTPRDDPRGVADVIAGSGGWTAIHLVILAGVFLMFVGLVAIADAIAAPPRTDVLVRLAVTAAALGTAFGALTLVLDGVAAKQLADSWAGNPGEVSLGAVTTNETINFALAGLFNLMFAGFPYLLLGAAMVRSHMFAPWVAWVAVAAGAFSVLAGMFQLATGHPTTTSLVLTIIGPSVITAWTLVVGILLWRRGSAATRDVPRPETVT